MYFITMHLCQVDQKNTHFLNKGSTYWSSEFTPQYLTNWIWKGILAAQLNSVHQRFYDVFLIHLSQNQTTGRVQRPLFELLSEESSAALLDLNDRWCSPCHLSPMQSTNTDSHTHIANQSRLLLNLIFFPHEFTLLCVFRSVVWIIIVKSMSTHALRWHSPTP